MRVSSTYDVCLQEGVCAHTHTQSKRVILCGPRLQLPVDTDGLEALSHKGVV